MAEDDGVGPVDPQVRPSEHREHRLGGRSPDLAGGLAGRLENGLGGAVSVVRIAVLRHGLAEGVEGNPFAPGELGSGVAARREKALRLRELSLLLRDGQGAREFGFQSKFLDLGDLRLQGRGCRERRESNGG